MKTKETPRELIFKLLNNKTLEKHQTQINGKINNNITKMNMNDVETSLLTLLQEEKIEVKLKGVWKTGKEALKHTFKELIQDEPVYRLRCKKGCE